MTSPTSMPWYSIERAGLEAAATRAVEAGVEHQPLAGLASKRFWRAALSEG